MTSREKQAKVKEENTKITYAAQSPKDVSEESVDDMLANVDQFIEGVYRDLSITPPKRSSIGNSTPFRTIVGEESSSSSQTSSPVSVSQLSASAFRSESTSVISPSIRRNIDTEIEKINRICDNVDQNLRSIGLIMNNYSANSISDDLLNTNLRNSPSPSTSVIILNSPSPKVITQYNMQNNPSQVRTSSPIRQVSEQVIDLSNLQTPGSLSQPVRHNNDDGDDVILVSADIPSVVDLCSPNNHQEMALASSSTSYRPLNRRRFLDKDFPDVVDTCREGPSSTRRRRIESSVTTSPQNKPTEKSNMRKSVANDAYMCPICMESFLQRQPTSTMCGHIFCKECIESAISVTHKCPICNKKISRKHTFRIYI